MNGEQLTDAEVEALIEPILSAIRSAAKTAVAQALDEALDEALQRTDKAFTKPLAARIRSLITARANEVV